MKSNKVLSTRSIMVPVQHTMLKGEAIPDFDNYALPPIRDLLAGAEADDRKWSAVLRDCHRYNGRTSAPAQTIVKVLQDKMSTRQVEIVIKPAKSLFHYEVTLAADHNNDWNDLIGRIRRQALKFGKAAEPAPKTEEPVKTAAHASPPITPAGPLADSVEKLKSFRSNIDVALGIIEEAKAGDELRQETARKLDEARTAAEPLIEAENTAKEELNQATEKEQKFNDLVAGLEKQLAAARKEQAQASAEAMRAMGRYTEANEAARPAEAALRAAETAHQDCLRMEEERAKALEAVPGVQALLMALNQMNVPTSQLAH